MWFPLFIFTQIPESYRIIMCKNHNDEQNDVFIQKSKKRVFSTVIDSVRFITILMPSIIMKSITKEQIIHIIIVYSSSKSIYAIGSLIKSIVKIKYISHIGKGIYTLNTWCLLFSILHTAYENYSRT